MRRLGRLAPFLALLLTLIAIALLPRLRLSGRLARLFPDDPAAKALGAYVDAFGGGDVTVVLVRGDDPAKVTTTADAIARACIGRPGVKSATTNISPPTQQGDGDAIPDPTLSWAFAGAEERRLLATHLTDEGMRARLEETRSLLLMPGSSGLSSLVREDPLRLLAVVRARARSIAATVGADETGALVADQGRARFVLVSTVGSALDSDEAKALIDSLERAIAESKEPGVTATIAGGAAIARDVERMIRRDLYLSSAISTVLVALAFVVTFRRVRALLAIGPPLLLGTLWTTGVAAALPGGVTAIAMGFASVVIGVGLDTGVHVYAEVERARRLHPDATVSEIAERARNEVARPTLTAAIAAACAFGAMALSRLPALRQLGLLCATGEVLTAIAILALTPTIAARLEKVAPATPRETPRAIQSLGAYAAGRRGARIVAGFVALLAIAFAILGPPRPGEAIVALKPKGLPSLAAQEDAIRLTQGTPGEIQLTVTQTGRDEQEVLARGEVLAALLAKSASSRSVEAIASWLPSRTTIAARLSERDEAFVGRADALTRLLGEVGFSVEPFASAIDHLRHPATVDAATAAVARLRVGPFAPLVARHVAKHPLTGETIVATYVRGPALDAAALQGEVALADPGAIVTGYPVLERSLRDALARDLPRVALVALVLVIIALRSVLRSLREVAVALVALAVELLFVALVVRIFHVRVHVYDALVLPVLIGITVDESMFLLHALREGDARSALRREGRAIITTACTTAAGFGALLVCGFPGLRDLGTIGVVGTVAGLLASLIVVPAAAGLLGQGGHARTPDPSVPRSDSGR